MDKVTARSLEENNSYNLRNVRAQSTLPRRHATLNSNSKQQNQLRRTSLGGFINPASIPNNNNDNTFHKLEPFPFKPEPSEDLRRAKKGPPPPSPSKFVARPASENFDYESDSNWAIPAACWMPFGATSSRTESCGFRSISGPNVARRSTSSCPPEPQQPPWAKTSQEDGGNSNRSRVAKRNKMRPEIDFGQSLKDIKRAQLQLEAAEKDKVKD